VRLFDVPVRRRWQMRGFILTIFAFYGGVAFVQRAEEAGRR
jgi:hypothetical protein